MCFEWFHHATFTVLFVYLILVYPLVTICVYLSRYFVLTHFIVHSGTAPAAPASPSLVPPTSEGAYHYHHHPSAVPSPVGPAVSKPSAQRVTTPKEGNTAC